MGNKDWGMDIPGRVGRRLRAREVTVTCLLAAFLFSACGQAAQPVSTETANLQPTNTSTPLPTDTRKPSSTKTLPRQPIFPTLNPTEVVEATTVAKNPCGVNFYPFSFSPDGNWYVCTYPQKFEILNNKGIRWEYSHEDAFGVTEYNKYFPPMANTVFWSQDGKYLFITLEFYMGDSPVTPYYNGNGLIRIELTDGKISTILPGSIIIHSISPTGRRLAYIDAGILNIEDMKTGVTNTIPIDKMYSKVGQFKWSADGLTLVMALQGIIDEQKGWPRFTDISVLNVTTLSATKYRINVADLLYLTKFSENKIYIKGVLENDWIIDLNSSAIIIAPTETPSP